MVCERTNRIAMIDVRGDFCLNTRERSISGSLPSVTSNGRVAAVYANPAGELLLAFCSGLEFFGQEQKFLTFYKFLGRFILLSLSQRV